MLMMRNWVPEVIPVVLLCVGCATGSGIAAPKHTPVPRSELDAKADAVLAYAEGAADALPANLFAVAPLEESGKDRVAELTAIGAAMREHFAAVAALKSHGILGEDNRGYLVMRNDEPFANATEKNVAQKSMSDENDRRKALYRGLAHASEEQGLTLTRVERTFASRRLARAAAGSLVQLPSNSEEFALLRASPIGKRIDAAAQPGDWVQLQ